MGTTEISYTWVIGNMVTDEVIAELSRLYSEHYGVWGLTANKPGHNVKLSVSKLKEWLNYESAKLTTAYDGSILVGYAIAIQPKVPDYGVISWVTQFVVHCDYRNEGVGKKLLFSVWGITNHFSWGLLSANPYAIRALESSTRRRCLPIRIKKNHKKLMKVGSENVPYLNEDLEIVCNKETSKINTSFPIDLSEINDMIASVTNADKHWELGSLDEGWEWFAFTFNDQDQISLSLEEVTSLIESSENVVKEAYSKMPLDNNEQRWSKYASSEVDFMLSKIKSTNKLSVIDFGCGTGRHSLEFAKRGHKVQGIDYIDHFIQKARQKSSNSTDLTFRLGDCRNIEVGMLCDLAICLYDVVGSFTNDEDNEAILRNIAHHLKPNGHAFISVMNYELTEHMAKNVFSFNDNPDAILKLESSNTMEHSGNVFNPDFYLLDKQTRIVYRREQFQTGGEIPVELVVRDRRFSRTEIETMCQKSGLEVVCSKYVGAGRWDSALDGTDRHSKEILLLCKSPKR